MVDYYKLLELECTATYDEILQTCKTKRFTYEAEISKGENVPALQSQLDLIVTAQMILLDADDREKYNEDLAALPKSAIIDPNEPRYFDYESIRVDDLPSWRSIVTIDDETDVNIYRELLDSTVKLPYKEIQTDILIAAFLTPSALASAVPSVLSYGLPGCGKSQISNLVSRIWGTTPTLGNATFATLRRIVGAQSSIVEAGKKYYLNNALCWDDISPGHLANEDKASLLKSSTTRATSVYKMPVKDSDVEFREIETFGLRFFSSIYPFFSDLNFIEMKRRMLIIQCEKSSQNVINFDSYDWKGLEQMTRRYWEMDLGANARRYVFLRKGVVTSIKKSELKTDRQSLCTDLLATGLTWGVWKSPATAIKALTEFYELNDSFSALRESPLKLLLVNILEGKFGIPANTLKNLVDDAVKNGLIDRGIRRGELTLEMRGLGWELNVNGGFWEKL
jgi:hypothetical protein